MRYVKKHAKSATKRSFAMALAFVIFVSLFTGTFGVFFSFASNPTHTGALNTYVPVEYVNLLPVEIGVTKYVNDQGNLVQYVDAEGDALTYDSVAKKYYKIVDKKKVYIDEIYPVYSRTTYGSSDFNGYFDIKVQDNGIARMQMKKQKAASSSDTSYVFSYTQVNQQVNLQNNPFLYLGWKANCRVNGGINFSITKGKSTYYIDNKGTNTIADDTIQELDTADKLITPESSAKYRNSFFTFYQIAEGRYDRSSDVGNNDFAIMNDADYSIDLYGYLYGYFNQKGWTDKWPEWSKGDYITINYAQHTLVSEKINTPLFEHYYSNWMVCGVGRIAMTQNDVLTPRSERIVSEGRFSDRNFANDVLTNHVGDGHENDIVYDNAEARSARLDDGTYVFRNPRTDRPAVFRWPVNRYININEIKAFYLDMEIVNTDSDIQMAIAIMGQNNTTDNSTQYKSSGYFVTLDDLIKNHSEKGAVTTFDRYKDVTMNVYDDTQEEASKTGSSYKHPSDQMVRIREIILSIPANAKVSFKRFTLKIENDFAPSTTSDTVYPWSNSNKIENLPPKGTPATSDTLDPSTGADTSAYNWAATSIPVVQSKVDLLAMTDQHIKYDKNGHWEGFEVSDVTGYWRTVDGKSHFTSSTKNIVYRAFRRRDKNVKESTTSDSSNYYMEIPVSTTPFLYYSYTLTGGDDKAAGLYFNFVNTNNVTDSNGTLHNYEHFYLGQSGLALVPCDGIMESTDKSVAEAHRALCSSANARTGVIDLRSIGYKDGDIAKILDMRFYLTGTSTEATFDYLFFGSETLKDSVKNTIARNSGDAFPWAITHDQFKAATIGPNSQFTFANRLDLIADMFDRKKYNLKKTGQNSDDASVENALGTQMDRNADGSITVKAKGDDRFIQAGTSFDDRLEFKINVSDLASVRYINYSVDADPGMRWTILIKEDKLSPDSSVAIRTWSDAMMTGVFSTNKMDSRSTVAKSYYREMTRDVFHTNWMNGSEEINQAEDEAFAMFTVPGDETGCFDLSQIQNHMSWDAVVSISFIVYKDPSLKSQDGTARADGKVTFNYAYLTSEPLEPSSWGAAPIVDGKSYSWGYKGDAIKFYGDDVVAFNKQTITDWGTNTGCADFVVKSEDRSPKYIDNDTGVVTLKDNHKASYSLYFSYTFTKKNADGSDSWVQAYPPAVMVGIFDNNNDYKLYSRRAWLGQVNDFGVDIDAYHGQFRHQMPVTGVVALDYLNLSTIKQIRVYYDVDNYVIHHEYTVIACSYDIANKAPSGGHFTLTPYTSKVANFSSSVYKTDIGIVEVVTNKNGTEFTGDTRYTKNLTVDLNRTPYLFYSIKYKGDATGTFSLETDISIKGQNGFFRDGKEADLRSTVLLQPGIEPSSANYMPQSETGCIDVKSWLQRQGALPANGIIKIQAINAFVMNGSALYYYMYFGAEADKTIDLLPEKAEADLKNGVSTHAALYEMDHMAEFKHTGLTTPDAIIEESRTDSTAFSMETHLTGDVNKDGFNDLTYNSDIWGYYNMCYGEVRYEGKHGYKYVTTGNNQTSGLIINLNETPYLHFSISQPETSCTTFLLQVNDYTGREVLRGLSAEKVKPWLSCYNSQSPAGQLMHISPQTSFITYYKDTTMGYTNGTYKSGDFAGVIDLRRWFTETNGYSDIISLERVRFYSPDPSLCNKKADVTVNHFYLSSSCGSAYSVTFDKNDGSDAKQTIQILKNANDQFVSDKIVENLGFKNRDGYTFMGWYLDPDWEEYFDITQTPIRENLRLYAGWLNNNDVVSGELNLVDRASKDQSVIANKVTTSGTGHWETDDEALHIRNTGEKDYTITIPINKAYSLNDSRSIYMGMDVSKTVEANIDLTNESRTSDGARIVLNLKSRGSNDYDIIGADFGSYFLTENNMLTAAPYNKQLPMYMHLANKNLLPVSENTRGYVYAKSISVTVPVGCAIHIRYATAAKAMEASTHSVVAPEITGNIIDLLDSKGDEGYVEQINNSTYEVLKEGTEIYSRTSAPTSLKQAHISGVKVGYVTLGSLYGLGDSLGEVIISKDNPQYLYYSIQQSDQSATTFNMWVSIYYSSTLKPNDNSVHPSKWSTFLDARDNTLSSQDDMISGSIPREAFVEGSVSGRFNLYEWYKDALDVYKARGEVPSDAVVTKIRITGIRLYTANSGTDATFNYLAIGGKDATDESLRAKASVVNASGTPVQDVISDVNFGQIVNVSLDQLTNSADAHNPAKEFLGWSFTGRSSSSVVWWNPNATNDKEYTSTNKGGSWSKTQVSGFVKNRRDISYQLTDYTKLIYPVFATTNQPTLTVKVSGSGSVNRAANGTDTAITPNTKYSETFGSSLVLRAVGDSFIGWYAENGQLLTNTKDYAFSIYDDTVVTAKFGTSGVTFGPYQTSGDSHSIVWLQRADASAGNAGDESGFYLRSVYSGNIFGDSVAQSNINDATGMSEIVCYWSIENGQLLEAVAKSGYHWEMLLQDGTTVCLGKSNVYRFISALDMKLICVPNTNSCSSQTNVIVNEYAVDFDRTDSNHTAKVSGQVFTADNEMVVECGYVMVPRPAGVTAPSFDSPESQKYPAQAWNSSTGQFVVSVDFTPGAAYYIRGYAIIRNTDTNTYSLHYSDYVTISF